MLIVTHEGGRRRKGFAALSGDVLTCHPILHQTRPSVVR